MLREVVFHRLGLQLHGRGLCRANPVIQLVLAAGKIKSPADGESIRAHFKTMGWKLWDKDWIQQRLEAMASGQYENQMSSVVTKLLLRKGKVKSIRNKVPE